VRTTALPYTMAVQTVLQTGPFLSAAKGAGMSEEEREALVDHISTNPTDGEVMVGTGGCRKLRYKKPGKGKSGSYRVVTFYGGDDIPVTLLTVFGKGEKDNLTKAERNKLKKLVERLAGC
jgi:hypothetical protein